MPENPFTGPESPASIPEFFVDNPPAPNDRLVALAKKAEEIIDAKVAERLDHLFTYHAPTPEQLPKYEAIRAGARAFALVVLQHTPGCADQSAAIRLIRDAMMTSNAAIALDGRS